MTSTAPFHPCLYLGITSFDGAEIYGVYTQEAALGAAMALTPGLRDKLELIKSPAFVFRTPLAPTAVSRIMTLRPSG